MVIHLELDHGAEVVVPEEHTELSFLHGGRELTQTGVRQLGGRAVQKLLGYKACRQRERGRKKEGEREREGEREGESVRDTHTRLTMTDRLTETKTYGLIKI